MEAIGTNNSGTFKFLAVSSKNFLNPLPPPPPLLSLWPPDPLPEPDEELKYEPIAIPTSARAPAVFLPAPRPLDFLAASLLLLTMIFPPVSGRTTPLFGVVGRLTSGTPFFLARSLKDKLLGTCLTGSVGKRLAPPMAPVIAPVRLSELLIQEGGKFIAARAPLSWASRRAWP